MSQVTDLTAGTWNVDPAHSNVGFVARHLMITKVRGHFGSVTGTVQVADDVSQSTVTATIETASLSTGDESRDQHLRSADFFDVERYPTISFNGTSIAQKGDHYVLSGDLTVKGTTRTVDLDVEFEGVSADPWGGTRAAFTAEAEINRKDWGLEWNVALEAGGVLVSEKVKLVLDVQLVKA